MISTNNFSPKTLGFVTLLILLIGSTLRLTVYFQNRSLIIDEAYVSQLKLNTTNTLDSLSYYKQLIYKKHQITESLFNRSMAHYSQDPKKLEKIYKEVKKQIEDLDSQLPHIDETENLILKEKQDTIESVVNKNQPFSNKNKP